MRPLSCSYIKGKLSRLTPLNVKFTFVPKTTASVICSGHFQSLAMLILGAKRLKSAADLGVAFQFGGAVMGAFLCLIMSITGSFSQISASAVLGYNMLLVLVALLVNKIKKV